MKGKRPTVPTKAVHWQLRYDCGELRTLPDRAMFRPIQRLLTLEVGESLPPEALMALEPKWKTKEDEKPSAPMGESPFEFYFRRLGVEWGNLTEEQQLLLTKATLGKAFQRYVELCVIEDVEPDGDLSPEEEDELSAMKAELGNLVEVAEDRYQRTLANDSGAEDTETGSAVEGLLTGNLHTVSGGNYEQRAGGRGWDSKDGGNFRQAKKRFLTYLRENGFVEMADHLEISIKSTGSNWSYDPPSQIEWTA